MKKLLSILILIAFVANTILPVSYAQEIFLPAPGTMVRLSQGFAPPILKGIKVYPDNPFLFDFILDNGESSAVDHQEEAGKLVKYFLASLTTPENDMWVNLSPYEKDRIVPESFGQTEMGRDLLAQDYMLKQITASLIYPEDELGKKFWERIYAEAKKKFGTTDIPVNTFNKVWIVPAKAVVYENPQTASAYVVESKLKVMLEEDYLALQKSEMPKVDDKQTSAIGNQVVREIVIPALTKEVNEGKNFSQLRQIYNSLILAAWYKKKIKDSILSQVYVDKNKVAGVNIDDPQEKQKIYERYLEAFKKGAYNYIKEQVDPATQESIPKKYFSGGFSATEMIMKDAMSITVSSSALSAAEPIKDGDGEIMQIKISASSRIGVEREELLATKASSALIDDSSLPQDVKRQIQDQTDRVISILEKARDRSFNAGRFDYEQIFYSSSQYDQKSLADKFIEEFQEIQDPQEIAFFARVLDAEWKDRNFDKDFGSVFEYVAEIFSDYYGQSAHFKKGFTWVYAFLEAASPLERALALRLLVVGFSNHLRSGGLHPENEKQEFGLSEGKFPMDQELLFGNDRDLQGQQLFQRYLLALLDLQKTEFWHQVIKGEDGRDNPRRLTYEDMFLWALPLLADPTVHEPWTLGQTREQANQYLTQYFGAPVEVENAGVKFLGRAFQHESLSGHLPEIENLLIKALSISDQQWSSKGQRSPFEFAFMIDNLKSVLANPEFWRMGSLRQLGDPMLILGSDFAAFPSQMDYLLRPANGGTKHAVLKAQKSAGLRPLYVKAFRTPELSTILPNLAKSLEEGSVSASSGVTPLYAELSPEIKAALDQKAYSFMSKIKLLKTGPNFRSTLYIEAPALSEILSPVTDKDQIKYLSGILRDQWDKAGFDQEVGPFNSFIIISLMEAFKRIPAEFKANINWVYHFLDALSPSERAMGYWLMVTSFNAHLRYQGFHPEKEDGNIVPWGKPFDHELLVGAGTDDLEIFQRFILSVLDLNADELRAVIPAKDGKTPNSLNITQEDLLLWGLVLTIDPTLYMHSYFMDDPADLKAFLEQYLGEGATLETARIKFLTRAFNNKAFEGKLPQIEALLMKAMSITDEQWKAKNLRTPYRFALAEDDIKSILSASGDFWKESAKDTFFDPIFSFGLDVSRFSPEFQKRLRHPRYSGTLVHKVLQDHDAEGLRPIYEQTYLAPELAAILPNLAQSLRSKKSLSASSAISAALKVKSIVYRDSFERFIEQFTEGSLFKIRNIKVIQHGDSEVITVALKGIAGVRVRIEIAGDKIKDIAYDDYGFDFLPKPVSSERLMATIMLWLLSGDVFPAFNKLRIKETNQNSRKYFEGLVRKWKMDAVKDVQLIAVEESTDPIWKSINIDPNILDKNKIKASIGQAVNESLTADPWADAFHKFEVNGSRFTRGVWYASEAVQNIEDSLGKLAHIQGKELSELLPEGSTILVAGFGDHWQELTALAKLFPKNKILGVDWLDRNIIQAIEKTQDYGNIKILQQDIRSLHLSGEHVSLVYSSYLIEQSLWADREDEDFIDEAMNTVFQKLYQQLNEGGYFIAVPSFSAQELLRAAGGRILLEEGGGYRTVAIGQKPAAAVVSASSSVGITIPEERKRELDLNVESFMRVLENPRSSKSVLRKDFYEAGFVRDLRRIQDPVEIKYAAHAINERWKASGLDKELGDFYAALAINYAEEIPSPAEVKIIYEWIYKFLDAADPVERSQALWAIVVSNNAHLRRLGLHPEGAAKPVFLDQELLLDEQGILQRFVESFLALTPEQLAQPIKGPEGSKFTREDLMLWALLLTVDPTTYNFSSEFNDDRLNEILQKYFGDGTTIQTAAHKFLGRVFENGKLTELLPKIDALLVKAFQVKDDEWNAKGLRSPFEFGLQYVFLKALLKTDNIAEAIAQTGVEEPVFAFAVDLKNFDEDIREKFLSRYMGIPVVTKLLRGDIYNLRKFYVPFFASPDMAAFLPNLAKSLEEEPKSFSASSAVQGSSRIWFNTFLTDFLKDRPGFRIADLGSGQRGEFEINLRKFMVDQGIPVGPDSVISLDHFSDKGSIVRAADVMFRSDREAAGIPNDSVDLVTMNNIISPDLVAAGLDVLKPGGVLIVTFAESDLQGDYQRIIDQAELLIKHQGDKYRSYRVDRPKDYPASNKLYASHGEVLIVTREPAASSAVTAIVGVIDDFRVIGNREKIEEQLKLAVRSVESRYYHPNFDWLLMRDTLYGKDPDLKYALAVDQRQNKVIGYVFFEKTPDGYVYLSSLGVMPEYQKSTVGTQLMQSVFDYARSQGLSEVQLVTNSNPENSAIAFYTDLPKVIPGIISTPDTSAEGKIYFSFTFTGASIASASSGVMAQNPFRLRVFDSKIRVSVEPLDLNKLKSMPNVGNFNGDIYFDPQEFETTGDFYKVVRGATAEDIKLRSLDIVKEANVLQDLNEAKVQGVPEILFRGVTQDGRNFIKMRGLPNSEAISDSVVFKEYHLRQKIKVLSHVAKIYASIHARNIALYDIKPDNIIIDPKSGEPMVIDFGASRDATAGEVYSDIYNLGIMVSQVLEGVSIPELQELLINIRVYGRQNPSYMHTVAVELAKIEMKLATMSPENAAAASSAVSAPGARRLARLSLNERDLRAFGALNSKEDSHGTQAFVYKKEGWPFVLKLLVGNPGTGIFPEETQKAYDLSYEALGGLVHDFVPIQVRREDGMYFRGVIMRKVPVDDLAIQIQDLMLQGQENETKRQQNLGLIKKMIDRNVELVLEILRRGVFPIDIKFKNFGMDRDRQVVIDPGFFENEYRNKKNMLRYSYQVNFNFLENDIGSEELAIYYQASLNKAGLWGDNEAETIAKIWGTTPPNHVRDISAEVEASFKGQIPVEYISSGNETRDYFLSHYDKANDPLTRAIIDLQNAPSLQKAEDLVHQFKDLITNRLPSDIVNVDMVIGVPPSDPQHTAVEYLANALAELLAQSSRRSIPAAQGILIKNRTTERQYDLTPELRELNVKDVFTVKQDLSGKTVLLLDDVRTTGFTLQESRKALEAAGARVISVSFLQGFVDRIKSNGANGSVLATAPAASSTVSAPGGIDLQADKLNLETKSNGGEIKFSIDPEQLRELQNVPGFTPVIINVQPLITVQMFLGLNKDSEIPLAISKVQ